MKLIKPAPFVVKLGFDMEKFKLVSDYKPTGDQPQAIEKLVAGLKSGLHEQVLLGVTGSGKTFSVANVIAKINRQTLVISHNKTLAGQLYQELKSFFPGAAVSYFVSYYDYYQPEAYIPQTDTYIEKETEINEALDKLRLEATTNLMTRSDTIVVASVSSIYNIGSPVEYGRFILELATGLRVQREQILARLTELQYERADFGFHRGTFRVRGNTIDIYPSYRDEGIRIELEGEKIVSLSQINTISGQTIKDVKPRRGRADLGLIPPGSFNSVVVYPAKHYMTDPKNNKEVFSQIRKDLGTRLKELTGRGKLLEARRLDQKVTYDLEMIEAVGYINGIENYSRYFDGRAPGEPPYTLFNYFKKPWLLVIDESHMTIPQIRGMYQGDRSRKQTLIDFGFRLPSALDNRPLKFDEFLRVVPQTIYTSATPGKWEMSRSKQIVEQLVRPTGVADPGVSIRGTKNQIPDLIEEIKKRSLKKQRVLVTTLTKRIAEDLSDYLKEQGLSVHYLHSDIKTLDRADILDNLRKGKYDVLIGINLLREGLDLPEVSLVAILDADKEGFLRSDTSLVQTMGRAARHTEGEVILYADRITGSMERALAEVERRRIYQIDFNKKHKITPQNILKPIREKLIEREALSQKLWIGEIPRKVFEKLSELDPGQLPPSDREKLKRRLKREMVEAARDLNFELAAKIRDAIVAIS